MLQQGGGCSSLGTVQLGSLDNLCKSYLRGKVLSMDLMDPTVHIFDRCFPCKSPAGKGHKAVAAVQEKQKVAKRWSRELVQEDQQFHDTKETA